MTTLILAEDDPHIALLVEYALESLGCRIESHRDGASALERLRAEPRPALVILDVNLPGVGGFDVLRAMKSDPRLASVPVLLLSASALESYKREARELGADRYLEKPFDVTRFAAVVGEMIDAPRSPV